MKKLLLIAVCLLPFFVGGLTIDLISGVDLGFFRLLSINVTVWLSIFLSNLIFLGFTQKKQGAIKDGK